MGEQPRVQVGPDLGGLVRAIQALSLRSVDLAERMQHASDVNPTDFRALTHVQDRPGITAGELAERLDRSRGATSTVLDRLERAGHVERRPDPRDRRRTTLWVTDRPRHVVAETLRPFLTALAREFEDVPAAELRRTATHVERITSAMRTFLDDEHPPGPADGG